LYLASVLDNLDAPLKRKCSIIHGRAALRCAEKAKQKQELEERWHLLVSYSVSIK